MHYHIYKSQVLLLYHIYATRVCITLTADWPKRIRDMEYVDHDDFVAAH